MGSDITQSQAWDISTELTFNNIVWSNIKIVKLREREGQRVDPGRSLKGHLKMVDGGYPFPDALH